ncbi:endo alpha-1,4 polygalactosaminidase [Kineococcus radiotolerans]|uniref:endo alpha-1,4 polygalactosaminidase n=1 Tax=Kineococcus radiotolerans TaxID=131568 RepID=UPI00059C633E|nr:endo alpha-1,4 polygalactosaminidase [Kineococcus radiotolerans]
MALPPVDGGFDYQLGGPHTPPPGVSIVERDRIEAPAQVGYDICYVNGFQTQPEDSAVFAAQHPELLVLVNGAPLVDEGWPDEYLFDTSTARGRAALVQIVGAWITGCADAGYEAVEIDNVDSYTRSRSVLTVEDNLALAQEYARLAHAAGLAIAQKNTAEQSVRLRAMGYDFAVTESCVEFEECSAYQDQYPVVLDVEYTDELGDDGFTAACRDGDHPRSMILRDHDLVTPEDPGYTYRRCGT